MTITLPDLSGLNFTAVIALAALCAAADLGWNVLLALKNGNFSGSYVADFLVSHVAVRVAPISFLAILGNGVPALGVPAIPVITGLAVAGLVAYLTETVVSLAAATKSTVPAPSVAPGVPAVTDAPAPPAEG